MSDGTLTNLIDVLISNKVITSASTTNNFVDNLPAPFYYTDSDINTYNDYIINLTKIENANQYEGVCIIDIMTVPIYDQVTHEKIGTVTFHDYIIKSTPVDFGIVNEKVIFKFDNDNSSITTDHTFFSDSAIFTQGSFIQRIVSGTGKYLNLFGHHVVLEKKEDKNRYLSIVHN
jgi:hypothetical protein